MTYRLYALACAALLATACAPAVGEEAGTRAAEILAQQQTIRADMTAERKGYTNMPPAARKSVLADQDELAKLLAGKSDTSQLSLADRAEVRRLQARIEATIRNNQEERPVCTQEARTGSNLVTRVCRTRTEIRERKEADQKLLMDENARIKCSDRSGCV
jgi:hypothetical protein